VTVFSFGHFNQVLSLLLLLIVIEVPMTKLVAVPVVIPVVCFVGGKSIYTASSTC